MLKYVYIVLLAGCLNACALFSGSHNVPVPQHLPVLAQAHWFQVTDGNSGRQSLLAVQALADAEGDYWRWVQTDAFGAPLARQRVDARGWRNDGFVPPNRRATHLFAAMLALMAGAENTPVTTVYPQLTATTLGEDTVYRRHNGRMLWRIRAVRPDKNEWEIHTAAGDHWHIRIIE